MLKICISIKNKSIKINFRKKLLLHFLGYVLSKEALSRFVTLALRGKGKNDSCRIQYDHGNEDVEIGRCLSGVDVVAGDSRDTYGKERFLPFNPNTQLLHENTPDWYWKLMYYDSKNVSTCYEYLL